MVDIPPLWLVRSHCSNPTTGLLQLVGESQPRRQMSHLFLFSQFHPKCIWNKQLFLIFHDIPTVLARLSHVESTNEVSEALSSTLAWLVVSITFQHSNDHIWDELGKIIIDIVTFIGIH